MKAALIGVAGAFAISLQAATFYYVLNVESRLTRVETTIDILRQRGEHRPAVPRVSAGEEAPAL